MNTENQKSTTETASSQGGVRCRADIHREAEEKYEQIKKLKKEILELERENLLLCDDEQWFTEKEEDVIVSKRPKKTEKHLIGRVHWQQGFKDEDTGEMIMIDRNEVVRVDGVWQ